MSERTISGAELIAAERERQLRAKVDGGEGWDAEHDRGHYDELAMAAATYAMPEHEREQIVGNDFQPVTWPWHIAYWKPTPDDRIRELTKAGALIAAAIDSIQDSNAEEFLQRVEERNARDGDDITWPESVR